MTKNRKSKSRFALSRSATRSGCAYASESRLGSADALATDLELCSGSGVPFSPTAVGSASSSLGFVETAAVSVPSPPKSTQILASASSLLGPDEPAADSVTSPPRSAQILASATSSEIAVEVCSTLPSSAQLAQTFGSVPMDSIQAKATAALNTILEECDSHPRSGPISGISTPLRSSPMLRTDDIGWKNVDTSLPKSSVQLDKQGMPECFAKNINEDVSTDSNPTVGKILSPAVRWTSLFNATPRNAGEFKPRSFDLEIVDGIMIPPVEVIKAGTEFWADYLVGFFLDSNPKYHVVKEHCNRLWRPMGSLLVHMDNSLYYFKFSRPEERLRILSKDPIFIEGKPFIVTSWNPSIDRVREQVLSIPVWAYFSKIPSVLQPMIGLNWLASAIGKVICFDANTVAREKLVYAKALIEISPDKPLPNSIKVRLSEDHVAEIVVRYGWKPEICATCCSFGHLAASCSSLSDPLPLSDRIPLPRAPTMKWIPKSSAGCPAPPPDPVSDLVTPDPFSAPSVLIVQSDAIIPDVDIMPTSDPQSIPDLVIAPPSESSVIQWLPDELAWCHAPSGMRYDPTIHDFYSYVSNAVGETRCLHYVMDHGTLILRVKGNRGIRNNALLCDASWDRKYIYSKDHPGFVLDITALFSEYLHVLGPEGSDSSSSWEEEPMFP